MTRIELKAIEKKYHSLKRKLLKLPMKLLTDGQTISSQCVSGAQRIPIRLKNSLNTCSAAKTVKFWDLETLELIGSVGPDVGYLAFNMSRRCKKMQGNGTTSSDGINSNPHTPIQNGTNGSKSAPSSQLSIPFSVDGMKGFDQMVFAYLRLPENYSMVLLWLSEDMLKEEVHALSGEAFFLISWISYMIALLISYGATMLLTT